MTERCEVCGLPCGPLGGRAKSWRCAGILAHRSRTGHSEQLRDELRSRFGTEDKQAARELLRDDLMALPPHAEVLDLYGGGLSAEWILSVRPDLRVTSAERDRKLWPALRRDAESHGYQAHCGTFESIADRRFDLIWLDLCGEPVTAYAAIRLGVYLLHSLPKLSLFLSGQFHPSDQASVLYVTLMDQDRNGRAELKPEIRRVATQALLDNASGGLSPGLPSTAVHLLDYPQAGRKGNASLWRIGPSFVEQARAIRWASVQRKDGREWHDDMAACAWQVERGERISADPRCWPHAEGTCHCARKGFLSADQLIAQGQRFAVELASRRKAA